MGRGRWSRRSALVLLAGLLSGGACGGGSGGGGQAIATTMLAGKAGGQPWTIAAGETDAFLSSGQADFFTMLYTEPVDLCTGDGFSVASDQILVQVPMTTGDYMREVTFVIDPSGTNQNLIATGHVVVDGVTATTVSGGLYARFDDNNIVNGQFQAMVCPQ